jgi:hypothetical protein
MPLHDKINNILLEPPLPNRACYLPANFIIDATGQVYFYQQEIIWNDDERRDWASPPPFINLKPKDIIQVPVASLEAFIKLNILSNDANKRYVSVASAKDTIRSKGLKEIVSTFQDTANHVHWKLRHMTQEESIVLNSKLKGSTMIPSILNGIQPELISNEST